MSLTRRLRGLNERRSVSSVGRRTFHLLSSLCHFSLITVLDEFCSESLIASSSALLICLWEKLLKQIQKGARCYCSSPLLLPLIQSSRDHDSVKKVNKHGQKLLKGKKIKSGTLRAIRQEDEWLNLTRVGNALRYEVQSIKGKAREEAVYDELFLICL